MRASRTNGIGLAKSQLYLFIWVTYEDAYSSGDDVERVLHFIVAVPGHCLRRADLHLGDTKSGPRSVVRTTFDLVEMPRIFHALHDNRSAWEGYPLRFIGIQFGLK